MKTLTRRLCTAMAAALAAISIPIVAHATGEYAAYTQGSKSGALNGASVTPSPMTVYPVGTDSVQRVIFKLDGATVLEDRSAPFEYAFTPSLGTHTMVMRLKQVGKPAVDIPAGTFTVANDDTPPPPPPPPGGFCVEGERTEKELVVPAGTTCEFNPNMDSTLHVTAGSLLVEGTLRMRPANEDVEHKIIFENVPGGDAKDTAHWVGGGMGPMDANDPVLDTDPGLWCVRDCTLDLVGTPRTGWTRDPSTATGWRATDEYRIAPTAKGDRNSRSWKLGDPVPQAYPDVPAAEVTNLTRNVVIAATEGHESHVFISTDKPQTIKWARIEHMGPNCVECLGREKMPQTEKDPVGFITGRWALHFHMMDDHHDAYPSNTGSLVEGVVLVNGAGRGFVAHKSDGVTFRDTVAYNVTGENYWWDNPAVVGTDNSKTDDILYDHALALDAGGSGFSLGSSETPLSNVIVDSAVAGTDNSPIYGTSASVAGVQWISQGNSLWDVDGFVAHNNLRNLYAWNNDRTTVEPFDNATFYNSGIDIQGAYGSHRLYKNFVLRGEGFEWHTVAKACSKPSSCQVAGMLNFDIDVAGVWEYGLELAGANNTSEGPERFVNGSLKGYTGQFAVGGDISNNTRMVDFVNVTTKDGTQLEPNDVELTRQPTTGDLNCTIRIQQADGDAWEIRYTGNGGNDADRTVTPIAPFWF